MTVEDCFELGKIAYSDADYYHTELWMEQALKQLDGGEESSVDMVTILDYLSYSIYQQGELERALDYTKRLLKLGEWIFVICVSYAFHVFIVMHRTILSRFSSSVVNVSAVFLRLCPPASQWQPEVL